MRRISLRSGAFPVPEIGSILASGLRSGNFGDRIGVTARGQATCPALSNLLTDRDRHASVMLRGSTG